MSSYVPSKIFKFVRPAMMKSVFEKCGVEFPNVDWERWGFKTSVLADAWKEMKLRRDGGRGLAMLDATLQDISDVGTAKTDVEAIIAEILELNGMSAPQEFVGMNTWEKAVWFLLHGDGGSLWHGLLVTVEARECSHTRRWHEFSGFRNFDLDSLDSMKGEIAETVRGFFEDRKKCESCAVEIYRKTPTLCYVYAELDDSVEYDEQKRPGEEAFEVRPIVHPFRVIISCDTETGIFALSVHDSKSRAQELAQDLIGCVFKTGGEIRVAGRFKYDPEKFLYHSHEMHLQPGDGVASFTVESITIAPRFRKKKWTAFGGERGTEAIDAALRHIRSEEFPEGLYVVTRIVVSLTMRQGYATKETFRFKIENGDCNLRNQPDRLREIGERLLDRWEVRQGA